MGCRPDRRRAAGRPRRRQHLHLARPADAEGGGIESALANFAKTATVTGMSTMNVSLPEELKAFVDAQAQRGGYGSTSEFVRDLIRREQDRQALRTLLLEGASSPAGPIADESYFSALRSQARSTD